jgi:hypothetical protein
VYGAEPLELKLVKECMSAASMAAKATKMFFNGDARAVVDFMRWVWAVQMREEKQRRAGERQSEFRVTWRYQWSARLVTDYRRYEIAGKRQFASR